jgi:hypothetical protein
MSMAINRNSYEDDYDGFGSGDEMVILFDTEEQAKMDSMYDRVYRAYRSASRFMPEDFSAEEMHMLLALKIPGF